MVTERPIVYRGAKEICRAVGIPYNEITTFVTEKGLPAWKIDGRGCWLALHEDLAEWIKGQRNLALKSTKIG